MKARMFALAVSIFMIAFTVNSTVIAQTKETKNTGKTLKQNEQKTDAKIDNAKTPIEQNIALNKEKSKETIKTDMKKNIVEKPNVNKKQIKHHQMPVKKKETKKIETEKK